jgi:antitoxin ParD1/3/4
MRGTVHHLRCRSDPAPSGGDALTDRQDHTDHPAVLTLLVSMPRMDISLPEPLRAFVEEQIAQRRYGTTSEYVRDLIRRDQDRQHLRGLLLAGATSEPGPVANARYFDDLRDGVDAASDG